MKLQPVVLRSPDGNDSHRGEVSFRSKRHFFLLSYRVQYAALNPCAVDDPENAY